MINKGYLTAKTDKESDEVYTPEYAVKPILEYIDNVIVSVRVKYSDELQYGAHLIKRIVIL